MDRATRKTAMDQRYETLSVEDKGEGLVLLILNRPQVANAINTHVGPDVLDFFVAVNADPLPSCCIIMTGADHTAIYSGGDIQQRLGMSDEEWQPQQPL